MNHNPRSTAVALLGSYGHKYDTFHACPCNAYKARRRHRTAVYKTRILDAL